MILYIYFIFSLFLFIYVKNEKLKEVFGYIPYSYSMHDLEKWNIFYFAKKLIKEEGLLTKDIISIYKVDLTFLVILIGLSLLTNQVFSIIILLVYFLFFIFKIILLYFQVIKLSILFLENEKKSMENIYNGYESLLTKSYEFFDIKPERLSKEELSTYKFIKGFNGNDIFRYHDKLMIIHNGLWTELKLKPLFRSYTSLKTIKYSEDLLFNVFELTIIFILSMRG